jgi:hypothetical protein
MENGDSRKQTSGNSEEIGIAKGLKTAQSSTIIQEADDFTHKWTNGEIIVNYERAKSLEITMEEGKNFWGRPKKRKYPFCNNIGTLIANYQFQRDIGTLTGRYQAALDLMALVHRGWAFNALKDAKQQQRDYEQEIERLKEQIDTLRKLNDKFVTENKRLRNLLPNAVTNGKGDTEVSDVGKI